MPKIYDIPSIKEQIGDLRAEATALVELAEAEDRNLTDEESARFKALTEVDIPALEAKLETAERMAALKAQQVRAQLPRNPGDQSGTTDLVAPENRPRPQFAIPRNRLKVFTGKDGDYQAYTFGQWLFAHHARDPVRRQEAKDWLSDQGVMDFRNAVTTTTTVPTETLRRLIEFREDVGASRQLAEVVTMASEFARVPRLTAGQTVYYPGKGVAITASDPTFDNVDLTAVTRGVLTQIANETQADSVVNMADRVASRAAHELAYREDVEFVTGDGSAGFGAVTGLETAVTTNIVTEGTPTAKVAYFGGFAACSMVGSRESIGIDTSEHVYFAENSIGVRATSRYDIQIHEEAGLAALNVQAVANVTMAMLHQMVGSIAGKYWAMGAAWLMNRQFYHTVVQELLYAQGGNTVAITESGTTQQLFGYPVVFSDAVPAKEA